ncbi:MAG: ATP-binding domain-containing protein [Archangium sp.]|nr:ATP-binding domain-containing protein [Archangium sp.]MDP3157542.1 ATP-binding domain-containing protein [Archangium sp.]MDP3574306.1 ATP-binding domain-containing protein [Archangium sp.]
METLSEREAAALAEEEAFLTRVQTALDVAKAAAPAARVSVSNDELRALREEAASEDEDDVGTLLHELAVRQKLSARTQPVLPDGRSPYLAHLRLEEAGESRDYLLGHGTFIDTRQNLRVVDWRVAPVAQLFYRYREGDHFEEQLPGRLATGTVTLRRVVVIHQGKLMQLLGDDFSIFRDVNGAWRSRGSSSLATGGAGTSARDGQLGVSIGAQAKGTRVDVTALLDAEQYAAIAAPADEPLLVLGSAGSGKTTVALHRLARLTVGAPEKIPLVRARVVVPEPGLARLAQRLLAPLLPAPEGDDDVGPEVVHTLDDFLLRMARRAFGPLPRVNMEPPALVTSLKRHPALYDALREAVSAEKTVKAELRPLWRQLALFLSDSVFLANVVNLAKGTLPSTAIAECIEHTSNQLQTKFNARDITDASRRTTIDGRGLDEGTPDELAGSIDVEDLPLLLSMLSWRNALNLPQASHLVLDEAEDFSLFDFETLRAITREFEGLTLAGDEAQQTHSSFAGWQRSLEVAGAGGAATVRLTTSYRCPRPIAELARQVLGHLAPQTPAKASREGVPVGRFHFPGEAPAHLFLAGALKDLLEAEPHASVAVITADAAAARRFFPLVSHLPQTRLVERGEFPFTPGLDVTDVDSVKGLEWDYVVIADANAMNWPGTDEGRRRLHVAVTRASHQLWLVSPGTPSQLIAAELPLPAPAGRGPG